MPNRPALARTLALLAVGLLPAAVTAASTSGSMRLDFTVLKDGDAIGHHQIELVRNGDQQNVSIKTDIVVKVVYVPVYRFEHRGSEVWQNGHLVSLRSQTNDDGEKHTLQAAAKDDRLEVTGDGTVSQASDEIIPASLWNRDLVNQTALLNTLTGKQMAIKVADLGADPVRVHGSTVPAQHYKVTGELERELWYDQSDRLVLVKFTAKDKSEISYVLE
jgi:hypothetical protein